MGSEQAAAVTRELRVRLPATPAEGAILALGDVDIVIVDESGHSRSAPTRNSLRTFRILRRLADHRLLLNTLPYLAIALLTLGKDILRPTTIPPESWLFIGSMVVGALLARVVDHLILQRRIKWRLLVLGTLSLLGLLAIAGGSGGESWMDRSLVITLVALWTVGLAVLDSLIPGRRVGKEGRFQRLSPITLRDMVLSQSDVRPGVVIRGIPKAGDLVGDDALKAIVTASSDLLGSASPAEVDQGWILTRSTGGVAELMRALDETRPDSASWHQWRSLPTAWKVAFHIAAIEASESEMERRAFLEKVREQSSVARIAEDLDAELRLSGQERREEV